MSRTQYTGTGKCKHWNYVVEAELSKLTYVEDIYWKFIRLYDYQQETKVPFLAIFGTFSQISSEITLKRW